MFDIHKDIILKDATVGCILKLNISAPPMMSKEIGSS